METKQTYMGITIIHNKEGVYRYGQFDYAHWCIIIKSSLENGSYWHEPMWFKTLRETKEFIKSHNTNQ